MAEKPPAGLEDHQPHGAALDFHVINSDVLLADLSPARMPAS
jgi:hypothetical protein